MKALGIPLFSKAVHKFLVPWRFTSKKSCFSSSVLGIECALPAAWNTTSNIPIKLGISQARFTL